MDPRDLRVTQNAYFSLFTHTKQLLLVTFCDYDDRNLWRDRWNVRTERYKGWNSYVDTSLTYAKCIVLQFVICFFLKHEKCTNSISYWPEDWKIFRYCTWLCWKGPLPFLFPSILGVRKDPVDIVFSDSDKWCQEKFSPSYLFSVISGNWTK